ncbi:MAG TPA: NUDIX hydrolase [Clostridiaceae bacterium]|nr:NUDIX hydrolase [Clostridiaceae bacterium]
MNQDEDRERDREKPGLKHRAPRIRFTSRADDPAPVARPMVQRPTEQPSDYAPIVEQPVARRRIEPTAHYEQVTEPLLVQRRVDPLLSEEVLAVDPRFIGRVFSVEVQDVRLPDGRQSKREVVRHPGGACVVALDSDQYLYLVRQHRVGTGSTMREIPAGKLDVPEDPLDCARRELAEETSVIAEQWDLLTRYYPSPGYTDEVISIYLARGLSKGLTGPDDGEFLSVERIHLSDALRQIREGLITDGKTCLGIFMAADYIGYFTR